MKLDFYWRKVSTFGQRLVGRWEYRSLFMRVGVKPAIIKSSSSIAKPRRPRLNPLYQPLPVKADPFTESFHVEQHFHLSQEGDSFSAQLKACRDQTWWNPQPSQTDLPGPHAPACEDSTSTDTSQPTKRSVSIRDIRERMNSDRRSTASTASSKSGSFEFEPGLKLLDGCRGGWRDMEMFID
jgi:hypothetical protein